MTEIHRVITQCRYASEELSEARVMAQGHGDDVVAYLSVALESLQHARMALQFAKDGRAAAARRLAEIRPDSAA